VFFEQLRNNQKSIFGVDLLADGKPTRKLVTDLGTGCQNPGTYAMLQSYLLATMWFNMVSNQQAERFLKQWGSNCTLLVP
jgi:hypothetical protein